jgi:hypothetical protein
MTTVGQPGMVAAACLLGLPAERLVYGDPLERQYWQLVAEAAIEQDSTRRDNQANANASAIAEVLRRMFRRGRRRAR